jgi:hypothetical protein
LALWDLAGYPQYVGVHHKLVERHFYPNVKE